MQLSTVVGQNEVGMAFNIEAETDEEFIDFKALLQNLYSHDVLSRTSYYWVRKSMSYENVTVSHNPDLSTATTVKITAAYGKIYSHFYFSISVYFLSQYVTLMLLSVTQFTVTLSIAVYSTLSVSQFTSTLSISVYCYSLSI
jgi:hypothetical protein